MKEYRRETHVWAFGRMIPVRPVRVARLISGTQPGPIHAAPFTQ